MLRNYNRTKEEEHKFNLSFITLIVGIINISLMFLVLQGAYSLHSPIEFVSGCIFLSIGWYCYIGYKFVKSLDRKEIYHSKINDYDEDNIIDEEVREVLLQYQKDKKEGKLETVPLRDLRQ